MEMNSLERLRIAFIGPMVGRNPGYVTTQGEWLADLFASSGYPVITASSLPNRYMRLADIVSTLIRHRAAVDVLMLQVYGGPSFVVEDIASWLGHRFGHRIIMTLHGGSMPQFMARYPSWTRRVFARAHALVTPSAYLARAVEAHGIRARVIPNVLDLGVYPYRKRRQLTPSLLWMRSFHPLYNPEMAVRVLACVRSEYPHATLVMAGQDKGRQAFTQRLAEDMGLGQAVRFPGFLDPQQKQAEGMSADIFINTNRVDNMPVAVLEACAMGLPVVATAVGGVPDLLTHGSTGLLVPDGDEAAMSEAIVSLLREPELARRLSENGRRLAERSAWPAIRTQWEELFADVMAPTRQGG